MDHGLVVLSQGVLCEEASGNTLCRVSIDVNEPAHSCIDCNHQDDVVPPGEASYPLVCIDMSQQVAQGSQEYRCHETVVFHWVEASHELVTIEADVVAFSSSVAEGKPGQSDVAVGVSSDEVETESKGTFLIAGTSNFVAACSRVTSEKLIEESGDFEKAIDEGPSNYASPMPCYEALEWGVPLGVGIIPVPISSPTRHAEVD